MRAQHLMSLLGCAALAASCSVPDKNLVDPDAPAVDAPVADSGTDAAMIDAPTIDALDAMVDAPDAMIDAVPIDAAPPPPTSVPALLFPWNGYATGSIHDTTGPVLPRRPTFKWLAAAGATHYRIEYTTSCTSGSITNCPFSNGVTTEFVASTMFTPAADLTINTTAPVGARIFWRVSACSAPVDASCNNTRSPIRYVDVGRLPDDLNGDGYSDVVVGAVYAGPGSSGRGFLWYGSPSGLPGGTTAAANLYEADSNDNNGLGWGVAYGDLNGDGYGDVAIGAPGHASNDSGRVCVWMGGSSLAAVGCNWGSSPANSSLGYNVAIGDTNADGFADITASATTEGKLWTYRGSSTTPTTTGQQIVTPGPGNFAFGLDASGDVNGDGYVDVVAGAAATPGTTYVFPGSMNGPVSSPLNTLATPAMCSQFGYSIDTGDTNNDGYADAAIGCDSGTAKGRVFIYRGSMNGLPVAPSLTIPNPEPGAGDTAFCRVSLGDIDGDGDDDVLVGAYNFDVNGVDAGAAYVYRSIPSGVAAEEPITNPSPQGGAQFGSSVDFNHDFNGDGRADIVVSASSYDANAADEGRAYAFLTSPTNEVGSTALLENTAHETGGAFGVNLRQ